MAESWYQQLIPAEDIMQRLFWNIKPNNLLRHDLFQKPEILTIHF
jgi:hypothetical protein